MSCHLFSTQWKWSYFLVDDRTQIWHPASHHCCHLVCLTLPVPTFPPRPYNSKWGLFTMRSLNRFGGCTLKPNTFPMRTTGELVKSSKINHVHLGCNILELYTFTFKKYRKGKKTYKRKKDVYVQCRLRCKWHNRWKRTNFLREVINIVLYCFILWHALLCFL